MVGKQDQIDYISEISEVLKSYEHCLLSRAEHSKKFCGENSEPVLVFYMENKKSISISGA